MKNNPLLTLEALGQSLWMDFIRRETISSGELQRLIDYDGLSGVTSNPSIFEKAIAESHDYDVSISTLARSGKTVDEIYLSLVIDDIQRVADILRPTYDRTGGRDGFVSLEVSPHLAHDTTGTILEARRLWSALNRSNVMIKVPATLEGLPAIQQLIGEGININITLLFGLPRYREVAEAYIAGLETLHAAGQPLAGVSSVASFFLSRIDVLVDPELKQIIKKGYPLALTAAHLYGGTAVASARAAYQIYKELFSSARFKNLELAGARHQRLLWASTSTKNPDFPDTKYVDALIGPETINTLPIETINAYRDHGRPEPRLDQQVSAAWQALQQLSTIGIDLDALTRQLEDEGVAKFSAAFNQLTASIKEKSARIQALPST